MKKFFLFEIKHWLRQPMTWIFLFINALLIFAALTNDNISIGSGGNVYKNAPLAIEQFFAIMSLIGLVAITSFFNATATRDFTYGMDQIVFASPIKKFDFFFGKFLGAFVIALIPYLGITLAAILAPLMPWVDDMRFGAFYWQAHVYGFLLFAFFNTLFGGAIIYAFATYFRNPVIAYLSSFGIIILYGVASAFTSDIENQTIAMLTDPIGLRAFGLYTKYWSPAERNTGFIGFEGAFLINRLIWASVGISVLVFIYKMFDFTKAKNAARAKDKESKTVSRIYDAIPAPVWVNAPLASWYKQWIFELKSIVKNNSFIILTSIGVINMIAALFSTGGYGGKSLPVTYNVVDTIRGSMYLFVLGFMVFYSGYVVFKDRDVKFNEIVDTTPAKSAWIVSTKIMAIITALAVVFVAAIFIGILSQLKAGYTNIELGVYIKSFAKDLLGFSFIVVLCYLFQTLLNNKYLAYFVIIVFIIGFPFVLQALRLNSNMLEFGSMPSVTYSDMNGFGPFIPSTLAFGVYWSLFCGLLVMVSVGMNLRGKEIDFKLRANALKIYLKENKVWAISLTVLFMSFGGWLFYNTQVINTYSSSKQEEEDAISYEKKYKKYANMLLPHTTDIEYNIDIFPQERDMHVKAIWWVKNPHNQPIMELHFNMQDAKNVKLVVPKSKLTTEDKDLNYNIYKLNKPLQPNDSIQLSYEADFINDGIENEVSFTALTHNGSFIHDYDFMPMIGYMSSREIGDKNTRRQKELPAKERMAKLKRNCADHCQTSYISNSATWVNLKTNISTAGDQIAIAPGSLAKEWKKDGRNYYTYQLKKASLNFFSFISAEYLVKRDKVNGIDVEIYYDKKHPYNVDKMAEAVKKSLAYYTENFGPYYHEQCRIIEFPRYASFAQAFPGTMPYSEGIGFIQDLSDPKDIDMITYVVSHEMGHQWWAHQVIGPRMQGSEMFSEGLAQYSALMVMEKMYGKPMLRRFLKYELDNYLRGRASEREYENPLVRTESQQYIHYNKASLIYYYLKEMIGEQQLNAALKNVVTKYAYTRNGFPTALNVMDELKAVTPDSMQYLLTDMFENITIFSNRIDKVEVKPLANNQYEVSLDVVCEKFRADSLGNEKPIAFNDYIDVGIFEENKEDDEQLGKAILYQRVKLNKRENKLTFTVNQKPYQVGLDPYHYLIDKVTKDNVKKAN